MRCRQGGLKLYGCQQDFDGCALWRMFIPHMNFPDSQFLFKFGNIDFSEFHGEVVVVQRQVGERNLKALKGLREHGYKLIYDLDDNVWSVPQGNPMKPIFDQIKDHFEPCLAEAHVITVSTRGLKSAVEQKMGHLKKPILICQNAVDMRLYRECAVEKRDDRVVIGWAGTNTHWEDVKDAWAVLPKILYDHSQVKMEFVGQPPPKEIAYHPRIQVRSWAPVGEYPGRLATWAWDIGLAPLVEHRFNVSKSPVKLLELAVQKVPTLCSDVGPYHDFCSLGGPDLKWLLCSFPSQWDSKLRRLVNEPDWRKHLGQLAYDVTQRFFNIRVAIQNWKRAAQVALEQN